MFVKDNMYPEELRNFAVENDLLFVTASLTPVEEVEFDLPHCWWIK